MTTDGKAESLLGLLRSHSAQALFIVLVVASFVAAFVYIGGFASPSRLSPARFVDALEASGGHHSGFRRAHSKGICFSGTFTPDAAARALSTAGVFSGADVPLTGRFALANGDPFSDDAKTPVRSMGLRLQPKGADEWRMANNGSPGLPFGTPDAFYELVLAGTPDPATGKPDPARMQNYVAAHPEFNAFFERMKANPPSSDFANDSYGSIDAFIFVAPDGTKRLVRWSLLPEDPYVSIAQQEDTAKSRNFVFDDLLARAAQGPIKWKFVATLSQPGDANRASDPWPSNRQQVLLGEVSVDRVYSEAAGNCRDTNYDPLMLPSGMQPSDDPLPFARSAVYSTSFRRRAGEPKTPSAVADQSVSSPP